MAWFVVGGVYLLYHSLAGNPTHREDNIYASTPICFMAGFFRLYGGSVREMRANLRALRRA